MKRKANHVRLPAYVKRGQIDISDQIMAAKLLEPLDACILDEIEAGLMAAIEGALTPQCLALAQERALKAKLKQLADNRKRLAAGESMETLPADTSAIHAEGEQPSAADAADMGRKNGS